MKLGDYTKKIVKRLAIAFAVAGVLFLVVGGYLYHPVFILGGIAFLVGAYYGFEIGNSRYD